MARIVLTCWGSHGDVDPFLGLGVALRARGHDVTVATIEYYRAIVLGAGLAFHPIRPHVDPTDTVLIERIMDRNRGGEFLLRQVLFPAVDDMFADVDAAASGADLLVSHPITMATPIVAEYRRIPWANAVLAPTSMFSTYDVPVIPAAPWLKPLDRLGHWPGMLIVGLLRRATHGWAAPVFALRQRLGLAPGGNPVLEGQHSPSLVLALYSRLLGDPQPDWPPHVVVTGHVFYDAPHGTTLPAELESFLGDGPPPVVFTLGSSVVLIARNFWRESVAAITRLGARAVLLAGPEHVRLVEEAFGGSVGDAGRAGILAVDRAPHSRLFPRASVVVHQCGIGTMAQSLRSGRPMLGVPFAHDQPDNAWRAQRLGMSRTLYPSAYRAPRIAAALQLLQHEPVYSAAAARVARELGAETGAAAACDALEQTFRLRRS